jgi:integrase
MGKKGRSTVYNEITSEEKLRKVNEENIQLEEDFLEYLVSTDRAKTTIFQYKAILHIFWCWNLENNKNKSFIELTKREVARFQNNALNTWGWSPRRMRMVKSVMRSLENYIINILDEDYPNYKKIWDKIESPVNEAVREKSVFTKEELQGLLDCLVDKKDYMKACFLSLAMNSGRRKAELARFKVSYFTDDNLICEGALYRSPEKMITKGRGQRGKLLYVYTLAKPFKPYLDLWLNERKELGIKSDWLFPLYKDGEWVDEQAATTLFDSWSRTCSRYLDKAFYPHSLRHRFVTALSEQGIPDNVIKDVVGWSDVGLVDVYRDIEAEDTFDKYFGAEGIKNVEKKGLSDL